MPTASSRRARVLPSCCAFAFTTQLASPVMAFDKDHVRYATASIVDQNGASGEKWSAPALRLPTSEGEIFCGFQFVAPTAIDNATVTVADISQAGVTFAAAAGKDDRPAQAQVTVRARFSRDHRLPNGWGLAFDLQRGRLHPVVQSDRTHLRHLCAGARKGDLFRLPKARPLHQRTTRWDVPIERRCRRRRGPATWGREPMLRSACRIAFAIALSTLFGPVDRAFSQVVSTISATPAQYSGAGETITFMIGFNSGNVAVAAVNVKSALGVAYTMFGMGERADGPDRNLHRTLHDQNRRPPQCHSGGARGHARRTRQRAASTDLPGQQYRDHGGRGGASGSTGSPFRERSSATRRRPRPAGPCYRTRFPGGLQTSRTRRRVTGARRTWIHCAAAQPIRRRPSIASRTRSTITGMPRPSVRPSRPVLEDNLGASPQRRPAQNGPFDAMLLSAASKSWSRPA